uniref:Doublecortin domain-containing protein n=1 Tax=Catharus ustulatus TaxID=91951 RepID=A0A8C3XXF5_CATUS
FTREIKLEIHSYNYEPPLPSVARASTLTKVPPAKKITFFKSGDPQFAGVKMAINQRSFKSFNALMDDLSHRVPLPFGVRTITTPRGIHCISELDQLEDGGCYLCSDKKFVKPISITSSGHRPAPPRNSRPSSTMRRAAQEGKLEDYSTPFTHHGPRIPKKITLVKNGESGFRRSIILNRRNARSFKTLLDEITEILQFPVKNEFLSPFQVTEMTWIQMAHYPGEEKMQEYFAINSFSPGTGGGMCSRKEREKG